MQGSGRKRSRSELAAAHQRGTDRETFGLPPSKPVGVIKDALKDAMLDGVILNSYEVAFEFMLAKAAELGCNQH